MTGETVWVKCRRRKKVEQTYSTSIVDDILDFTWRVDHARIVRASTGELSETRNDQRETLAVGDMPMELAHLWHSQYMGANWNAKLRTLTKLIASSVRLISATGKLKYAVSPRWI